MGPDFVPAPPPNNDSSIRQGSPSYNNNNNAQCHVDLVTSSSFTNETPSAISIGMTGTGSTGYPIVASLDAESIYGMMTSYSPNVTIDNASNNASNSNFPSTLFNCNEIDNGHQEYLTGMEIPPTTSVTGGSSIVLDNQYQNQNQYPNQYSAVMTGPKTMADSTESVDTVSSSSSGEIFTSEYTDTVSSTTSSAFLIRPSESGADSSDDEMIQVQELKNATMMTMTSTTDASCYNVNDGYMSYSSTEVLNDDESYDNDNNRSIQENLLLSSSPMTEQDEEAEPEVETTTKPMMLLDVVKSIDSNLGNSLVDFHPHPLSPIKENEIVSFTGVTEVEPSHYTKITDNIIVVDESFLFNSNTNLGELDSRGGNGKQRAGTMHNLHERSSFLDLTEISRVGKACQKALVYLKDDITMGSLVSLNTAVAREEKNNKDPMQSLSLISGGAKTMEGVLKKSSKYTKNLLALSVTIALLYVAVGSVRNLQSSINHEGGVGVIGLAFNFVGYVMGSMFSSSVVQSFQPRKCLIANLFPNLLYIAANLYPAMWVMAPISFIQGISLAIIGNACSTYITHLAKGCAQKTKETFAEISCRYFGTYSLMYISHLIVGNLIASLILQPSSSGSSHATAAVGGLNSTNASSLSKNITDMVINNISSSSATAVPINHLKKCGPNFCQHFEIGGGSQFSIAMETKYTLFGVYFGCIILALLIAVLFMEPLNANLFRSTVSPIGVLKQQMTSLTRFFTDVKFILLLPLLMQSVMQFAFVTAEFAKGYITCALGMHMIGYTMICFGVCSSISSFLCGLLNKYFGRIPFILTAAILNLGCLVYMLQWLPTAESLVPYFVIMGLWGVADGFWTAQVTSLMGLIFPEKIEEAYAGLRMTQGLGAALTFGYSSAFCMTAKIYITVAICSLGLVGYFIVEWMLRRRRNTSGILLKQTSV